MGRALGRASRTLTSPDHTFTDLKLSSDTLTDLKLSLSVFNFFFSSRYIFLYWNSSGRHNDMCMCMFMLTMT